MNSKGSPVKDRFDTPTTIVKGCVQYTCCGKVFELVGDSITQLTCPVCNTSYDIILAARAPSFGLHQRGTVLRITQNVTVKLGASERLLKIGELYKAGADNYQILGTNENVTLLEIASPISTHPNSHLLAPISNEFLEVVPPKDITEDLVGDIRGTSQG